MEKKTIGSFIAALRKASGMTQKQLAEKLNVSDKSVSRWERDECAPDLVLIPVLAEIFGVTSDELLRGERRNPDAPPPQQEEKKTEKQLRRLFADARAKLQTRSIISVAIALVGLIVAMGCNLGFLRAYLGFFLGSVFYVVAAVLEAIFLIWGYNTVNDSDFDGSAMEDFRRALVKTGTLTFGTIIFLFSVTLPLILIPWDPYLGLDAESWLGYGLLYGIIAAAVCMIISWSLNARLIRSGFLSASPLDTKRSILRKNAVKHTVIILVATCVIHWGFNQFTDPTNFVSGITFDNWDDFKTYMETPTDYDGGGMSISPESSGDTVYITENGSYIYPEETATETVQNKHGQVLCSYENLNLNVVQIHYGSESNDLLPVTVFTNTQRIQGSNIQGYINIGFMLFYVLELVGIAAYYIHQNKKLK